MKLTKGLLIAVEGIDGSGKSTLISGIAELFRAQTIPLLTTKEPGGSSLGKELRAILQKKDFPLTTKAEFLLFAADRAQHFSEIIIPHLNQGYLVISDRLADSSLAYQGYGRGLDLTMLSTINSWAMDGYAPDYVLFVDLAPQVAFERIKQRNETITRFEQEKISFFQTLADGYRQIFKDRSNVITLDGSVDGSKLLQQAYSALTEKMLHDGLLKK